MRTSPPSDTTPGTESSRTTLPTCGVSPDCPAGPSPSPRATLSAPDWRVRGGRCDVTPSQSQYCLQVSQQVQVARSVQQEHAGQQAEAEGECGLQVSTVLHTVLYCTVLYCTVLLTVLYCTVLYCTLYRFGQYAFSPDLPPASPQPRPQPDWEVRPASRAASEESRLTSFQSLGSSSASEKHNRRSSFKKSVTKLTG